MQKVRDTVSKIINMANELLELLFELIIGLIPFTVFTFFFISILVKGFRVIVLGEQP